MTDQTNTAGTPAEKTPEQIAQEAIAATARKAQEKADANAKKAAEKAEATAKKAAEKLAKDKEKADAKAKREAETAAKAAAKAEAKTKVEAVKMPEQNGVRRPKPGGACAKVWELADSISATMGQPVPIATLSTAAGTAGINESTIRTQYALWRKYHGVVGRVTPPAPAAVATTVGAQAAAGDASQGAAPAA